MKKCKWQGLSEWFASQFVLSVSASPLWLPWKPFWQVAADFHECPQLVPVERSILSVFGKVLTLGIWKSPQRLFGDNRSRSPSALTADFRGEEVLASLRGYQQQIYARVNYGVDHITFLVYLELFWVPTAAFLVVTAAGVRLSPKQISERRVNRPRNLQSFFGGGKKRRLAGSVLCYGKWQGSFVVSR